MEKEKLQTPIEEVITDYAEKLKKLSPNKDEMYVGGLSEEDKFQLLSRYFNNFAIYLQGILQLSAELYNIVKWIAEGQGIDIKAKQLEVARKTKEQMEEKIKQSKEEVIKASKKA